MRNGASSLFSAWLLLVATTIAFPARAGIEADPAARAWRLVSGSNEMRLRATNAVVFVEYFGLTNTSSWKVSSPADVPHGPSSPGGAPSANDVVPLSQFRLVTNHVSTPARDVSELVLVYRHPEWPVDLTVRYRAWGATGVFTRQASLTNMGIAPVQFEGLSPLAWTFPEGRYELAYLWGTSDKRSLGFERLSIGTRILGDLNSEGEPHFASWFSLLNQALGVRYLVRLMDERRCAIRFDRSPVPAQPEDQPLQTRILCAGGQQSLGAGDSLELPAAALTASAGDLDEAANRMHQYEQFDSPNSPSSGAPVIFDTVNTEIGSISDLSTALEAAARVGAELFLLDSRWEDPSHSGAPNPSIFRDESALIAFATWVRQRGLQLGLTVNGATMRALSPLLRAHPDWRLFDSSLLPAKRDPLSTLSQGYAKTLENAPAQFQTRFSGPAREASKTTGASNSANDWEFDLRSKLIGQLTLDGAMADWPTNFAALVRENVSAYKRIRPLILQGDLFHFGSPPVAAQPRGWMGFQFAASNGERSAMLAYRLGESAPEQTFSLRGLLPEVTYQIKENGQPRGVLRAWPGATRSLTVKLAQEQSAAVIELEAIPGQPIIRLDTTRVGRVFEGIGALSAGASSRLLRDYLEPSRSRILDLLFTPTNGASFQHLKVEVGGDINSTAGCEPSHMRSRDDRDFQRGYEWWLMKEAKRRNPSISLDCLEWGAPAWVGNGYFFSQDNAEYLVEFIRGARQVHNLDIDFIGVRNEDRYDAGWIKLLRRTLDQAGFSKVRLVAADQVNDWTIVKVMASDPELAKAVDVVGVHYPSWASTPEAQSCGKPLWSSEDSAWRDDWDGARQLARALNRNYVQGKMTRTVLWSLVTSYYDNLPAPSTGPIRANEPWSGHFSVRPVFWAVAHTTQFAAPGWRYVDGGCGYLPYGGSLATLLSTNHLDLSMVAETAGLSLTQKVEFKIDGPASKGPLQVWRSSPGEYFVRLPDVQPVDGHFAMTFNPDSIYSLTTTSGQRKPEIQSPPPAEFPAEYKEDFDSYAVGTMPRYFADQAGIFETVARKKGGGLCLEQVIAQKGSEWESHLNPYPETFIGDASWRDYSVSVDAHLDRPGFVSLFGRIGKVPQGPKPPEGYWMKLADTGAWELGTEKHPILSGHAELSADGWNNLALVFQGSEIQVQINQQTVAVTRDTTYSSGMSGFGCGWHAAQFDNFSLRRAVWDRNLARWQPARSSSAQDVDSVPAHATDGNAFTTRWMAAEGTGAGEWIEVDFGKPTRFARVALAPFEARVQRYAIQQWDGTEWRDVQSGQDLGPAPVLLSFEPVTSSKVRFLVLQAQAPPSLWEFQVFDAAPGP